MKGMEISLLLGWHNQARVHISSMLIQVTFATLCQLFLIASFTPPKTVRVGGIFPNFDIKGSPNAQYQGHQALASFLLAIKEVNADPTILPNTTILLAVRDTRQNVGKAFFASLDLATEAFAGKGVDACIGSFASSESVAAATVFTQFSTPQISYGSTSPLLSTKISYPFFARTCPSDAFQGAAMADLVATYYGW